MSFRAHLQDKHSVDLRHAGMCSARIAPRDQRRATRTDIRLKSRFLSFLREDDSRCHRHANIARALATYRTDASEFSHEDPVDVQ